LFYHHRLHKKRILLLIKAVLASVEKHQQELIRLSNQIWGFAETAMKETKSSKVLADYAQEQGFRVTRGVAEIPTAFIAEYGRLTHHRSFR
jgi:aminobenzoyl-glutamate utilization protein B